MATQKPKAPIAPVVPPVEPTPAETKKSQAEADKIAAAEQQAPSAPKQPSIAERAETWRKGLVENNATQTPDFVEVYNQLLGEKETFNGYNIADDERRRTNFLNHFTKQKNSK